MGKALVCRLVAPLTALAALTPTPTLRICAENQQRAYVNDLGYIVHQVTCGRLSEVK